MKKYLIFNSITKKYLTGENSWDLNEKKAMKFDSEKEADNFNVGFINIDECEIVIKTQKVVFPEPEAFDQCGGSKCKIHNCPVCKNEMY